jgi:hypothetical protein
MPKQSKKETLAGRRAGGGVGGEEEGAEEGRSPKG